MSDDASSPPNTPRERDRVAYQAFQRVADAWRLTGEQRCMLLGISESSALQLPGCTPHLDRNHLERISYVVGIYSGLAAIFENAPFATEWVNRPNRAFGDRRPLDRMLAGNMADLACVREYVDKWRNGP